MQILDGGTWTSCLSDRSTSFLIGNDQVEVTSKSDNDWRNLIAVGTRTAEITASGVWTDRRSAGILMSSSLSSSPIQVRLIHGPSGGVIAAGQYVVIACARFGEGTTSEQYSFRLSSAGISSSGILDVISASPAFAYAPWRLRDAYSGPIVRVSKSGSAAIDVGIAGDSFDSTSLQNYSSDLSTVSVSTAYDQTPNARHATASGTGPIAAQGGSLQTFGGVFSPYFNGSQWLSLPYSAPRTGGYTVVAAAMCDAPDGDPFRTLVSLNNSASSRPAFAIYSIPSTGRNLIMSGQTAPTDGSTATATSRANNIITTTLEINGGNRRVSAVRINGTTLGATSNTTGWALPSGATGYIGRSDGRNYDSIFNIEAWSGPIAALIIFPTIISQSDIQLLETELAARFGVSIAG